MASGDTKTEQMLNVLANGGDASQFSGCCNTKTQNYILGAIDRVQSVEDEVEELKNNPDVVDIVDTYADLQAYDTQHLTENDIIRVLQDETHSGNSTYYRFTKNPDTWTFIGEISGGSGDTVYSTKTTSAGVDGGAVYVGNLDSNQDEQEDPTTTDEHYKYFWALPSNNSRIPPNSSINILGSVDGTNDGRNNYNSIMLGSGATSYAHSGIAIGNGTKADGQSVAIGSYASGGDWSGKIGMVAIGTNTLANNSNYAVHIGGNSGNGYGVRGGSSDNSIAIGKNSMISNLTNSVALGAYAQATRQGEVNVGLVTGETTGGYNNTAYRVLGGVHDGQNAHDAATVAQGNTLSTSAPDSSTVGVLGQLWTDTTNMHTYQCTAISGSTYTWTQRW